MWTLDLLPYLAPLLTRPQQPDNLCGPYWIALLLQCLGGRSVSVVEVAIAAQTLLPDSDGPWTPPGALSVTGEGYSQITTTSAVTKCGTSLVGLMRATQQLSQGEFCLLPLRMQSWEAGLADLLRLCQIYPDWQLVPLLNSHTGYFWGSHLALADLFRYLQTGERAAPAADWSVGHFALLAGQLQGQAARLYAVLDTYPHFGWQGLHLQPGDVIARSLARPRQATEGGIALFIAAEVRSRVEQAVTALGAQVAPWDNGTPAPDETG
ncbi:MAG: hypothetical protein AAFZ80_11225 [Cyanobacteria bacterium P01_A01_bin.105]